MRNVENKIPNRQILPEGVLAKLAEVRKRVINGEFNEDPQRQAHLDFAKWLYKHGKIGKDDQEPTQTKVLSIIKKHGVLNEKRRRTEKVKEKVLKGLYTDETPEQSHLQFARLLFDRNKFGAGDVSTSNDQSQLVRKDNTTISDVIKEHGVFSHEKVVKEGSD